MHKTLFSCCCFCQFMVGVSAGVDFFNLLVANTHIYFHHMYACTLSMNFYSPMKNHKNEMQTY